MNDKEKLLKRYWHHDAFRPLQEEIIDSLLAGRDTLALLPTGGGKSLCYQLPTLLREGLCLVVSPLIALMKDQVQQLNDRHLKAACIVSGMSPSDISNVLNNAVCGELKFLYVSPERLQKQQFLEHYRKMKVAFVAVDEAHCISQWGYDFRPPYLSIADIRPYHPDVPFLAVTATATPRVADDICRHLQLRDPARFQASMLRPNLAYMVLRDDDKKRRLLRIVSQVGGCGIVYTRNRRGTQAVAQFLVANGITATFYHAGLDATERDSRQAAWMKGSCRVMVATNAFGMGVDKGDVRFVVHLDLPDSPEAYFQEAGRAGRDGKPSYAVLLCDDSDRERLQRDFESDFPSLKFIRNVYRALGNFYRLPVGAGADQRFDFAIEKICANYDFPVRAFYSACRFLEREGLIAVPDQEEAWSTLHIPLGRDELYRFQVSHQRQGDMLQALMRMYPGLLQMPVAIDERRIASRLYAEPADVVVMLTQLNDMHVVEYRPRSREPQIVFVSPRVDESSICRDDREYRQLSEASMARREAMLADVDNDHLCRTRQLVAYFGAADVDDCGVCDVCLHRQPQKKGLEDAVKQLLKDKSLRVGELSDLLQQQGYAGVREALRRMLDDGAIYIDGNSFLRCS